MTGERRPTPAMQCSSRFASAPHDDLLGLPRGGIGQPIGAFIVLGTIVSSDPTPRHAAPLGCSFKAFPKVTVGGFFAIAFLPAPRPPLGKVTVHRVRNELGVTEYRDRFCGYAA